MSVTHLLNTKTGVVLVATEDLLKHGGKHLVPYDPDSGPVVTVADPAIAGYRARIKELEEQVLELQMALEKAVEAGAAISPFAIPAKFDEKSDATPDFNRITTIADAISTLTPDQFTTTGLPRADALEALVGKTTSEERQAAMEMNKQLKE